VQSPYGYLWSSSLDRTIAFFGNPLQSVEKKPILDFSESVEDGILQKPIQEILQKMNCWSQAISRQSILYQTRKSFFQQQYPVTSDESGTLALLTSYVYGSQSMEDFPSIDSFLSRLNALLRNPEHQGEIYQQVLQIIYQSIRKLPSSSMGYAILLSSHSKFLQELLKDGEVVHFGIFLFLMHSLSEAKELVQPGDAIVEFHLINGHLIELPNEIFRVFVTPNCLFCVERSFFLDNDGILYVTLKETSQE